MSLCTEEEDYEMEFDDPIAWSLQPFWSPSNSSILLLLHRMHSPSSQGRYPRVPSVPHPAKVWGLWHRLHHIRDASSWPGAVWTMKIHTWLISRVEKRWVSAKKHSHLGQGSKGGVQPLLLSSHSELSLQHTTKTFVAWVGDALMHPGLHRGCKTWPVFSARQVWNGPWEVCPSWVWHSHLQDSRLKIG